MRPLPCPFCGAQPQFDWIDGPSPHGWARQCANCYAFGPVGQHEDHSIELWNHRVPDSNSSKEP